MFEFPRTLITKINDNRDDFVILFSSSKGGWFVIKLEAAKEIRRYMSFFTLSHFSDNNL